jgi:hypothetical protein
MYCHRAPASRSGLTAHQQDSHRGLVARTGRKGVPGGPRGWRTAVAGVCRTRCGRGLVCSAGAACPPTARQSLRSVVGRVVFRWPGWVPRIGTPWKASHGRGGVGGGRSSGAAPLACLWPLRFAVLGRPRNVISARSCVKARPRSARCCAALTPAHSDWASRRKDGKQKLQRPAAYRPGERRARFSPPPLETQRPWEAKPPLHVAAAHSPQKNSSEEH